MIKYNSRGQLPCDCRLVSTISMKIANISKRSFLALILFWLFCNKCCFSWKFKNVLKSNNQKNTCTFKSWNCRLSCSIYHIASLFCSQCDTQMTYKFNQVNICQLLIVSLVKNIIGKRMTNIFYLKNYWGTNIKCQYLKWSFLKLFNLIYSSHYLLDSLQD